MEDSSAYPGAALDGLLKNHRCSGLNVLPQYVLSGILADLGEGNSSLLLHFPVSVRELRENNRHDLVKVQLHAALAKGWKRWG